MAAATDIILDEAAPSHADFVERARALVPAIAACRDEAEARRDISPETMQALSSAGLNRLYQPARWGGYQADPRTFYAVQNVIAEACPSTAWVLGVHAIQSYLIAMMDEQAQADVWSDDPAALACSSAAPVGVAEPVEGGFRLSGRWSFASGSTHAQWGLLGARIAGAAQTAGPPPINQFLVPLGEIEILDVWQTYGLRATGSNDLVAKDIFVPGHRHIALDPGLQNVSMQKRPLPELYRMPWLYMFSSTISNLAIGIARGTVRAFAEVSRARVSPLTGKAGKDDPACAAIISRLLAEADTADAMYERHIARQLDYVRRDDPIPVHEALVMRNQLTSVVRRITAIVDEMALLQGSRAVMTSSIVTRNWLDLLAARTHFGNDPTMASTMLGAMVMNEPAVV